MKDNNPFYSDVTNIYPIKDKITKQYTGSRKGIIFYNNNKVPVFQKKTGSVWMVQSLQTKSLSESLESSTKSSTPEVKDRGSKLFSLFPLRERSLER